MQFIRFQLSSILHKNKAEAKKKNKKNQENKVLTKQQK